jgi:hypothetical protein
MALHSSLPIYRDVYALTVLVANLVSNIPRKHKRRGDKLDDECSVLMVLVFRANVAQNKVPYLSESSIKSFVNLTRRQPGFAFFGAPNGIENRVIHPKPGHQY